MATRQTAAMAIGDVTGDRRADTVRMTGVKAGDSSAWEQLRLEVQLGCNCQAVSLPLTADAGFEPRLLLSPLTGTGKLDILALVLSGGSGAILYFALYTYENGAFRLVLDNEMYEQMGSYTVAYQNGYAAQVRSLGNGAVYRIDLSGKGQTYLDALYDANGQLKTLTEGFVSPASVVSPIAFSGSAQMELMTWQLISGSYRADALGYVINVLRWSDGAFELYEQTVGVNPAST